MVADIYPRPGGIGIGTKLRNTFSGAVYLIAASDTNVINMFNIESGMRLIPTGMKVSDVDNLDYTEAVRLLDNLKRWEIIGEY